MLSLVGLTEIGILLRRNRHSHKVTSIMVTPVRLDDLSEGR